MKDSGSSKPQRKSWKIGLRVLAGVVIAVVVAALVIPYFLDVDRYRTLIAGAIERETGRKVSIAKIRARLLPHVGFVVEDFRLGNPPGFGDGNLLTAEAIRGNLAWGPLFQRRFEFSSIELVRPKLTLLEDARGRTNYSFEEQEGSGRGEKAAAPAKGGSGFELGVIDRVDLTDAELAMGRVAGARRAPVMALKASKLDVRLNDVAVSPLHLSQWKVEAPLDGVVLALAGWKKPLEFRSGQLRISRNRLESEFHAAMGDFGPFHGTVKVADLERPVATFAMDADRLNAESLLALRKPAPAAQTAPTGGKSELVAQGRMAAKHLEWGSYEADNASAGARLYTNRTELWPIGAELYGGSVQISARTDTTQTPARFSANVQVRNLDVGRMMAADPAMSGKLSGLADLDLQLFGSIGDDWQKPLSGSGQFIIRNGRLPKINLAGTLQVLARATGVEGDTPFHSIAGDLKIGQGRITSQQIHMDAPMGTLDLRGDCGLNGALHYDGKAVLSSTAEGAAGGPKNPVGALAGLLGNVTKRDLGGMTIPFALRGTLSNPKLLPGSALPSFPSKQPPQQTQPSQQLTPKQLLEKALRESLQKPPGI